MGKRKRRSHSSKRRGRSSRHGSRNGSRSSRKASGKYLVVLKMFACILAFVAATGSGLYIIDTHVARLDYVHPLLQSFDPDLRVWQENIRSGSFGDLGRHDRRWRASRSLGYSSHQDSLGDLLEDAVDNVHLVILIFMGCGLFVAVVLLSIK